LLGKGGPDLLGDPERLVAAGSVEDRHEFLAAVARDQVAGPEA
jgi:hypothetical protein